MRKLLFLFLIAFNASATTYYIDYGRANDNGTGLTTAQAFKRHPYMAGFTGTYIHASGDVFIFKGGVTWPNACFRMTVTAAGTSSGSRDLYTVDTNWYAGASWTRPVWDAGGAVIGGVRNQFFWCDINGAAYLTLDNILVTGYRWTSGATEMFYIGELQTGVITFQNMVFTNWSHGSYAGGARDDGMNVLMQHGNNNSANVVSNCVFDGRPNGTDSGMAVKIIPIIKNSRAGNMANGFLPGGINAEVSGFVVGPINNSFDANQHENNIETLGGGDITIHDGVMFSPTAVCFLTSSSFDSLTIYNVLVTNCNVIAFQFDAYPPNNFNYTVTFFNNTVESVGGCMEVVPRGGGCITAFTERNNHYITDSWTGPWYMPSPSCITTYLRDHNLTNTLAQAQANGYVVANGYAPANATKPTVNAGTSTTYSAVDGVGVTRPKGGAVDIGRYEWNEGGSVNTNPPVITGVNVNPTNAFTAQVNWTTDIGGNSRVHYGTTTAFGSSAADGAYVTSHAISLSGLSSGTAYYYKVASTNADGYGSISATNQFTTLTRPPTPWYVSTNAAGSDNGTSWANAWSPTSVAWTNILPGDTLYFDSGTYSNVGFEVGCSGTASEPIKLSVSGDSGHNGAVIFDWSAGVVNHNLTNTAITCVQDYVQWWGSNRWTMRNLANQTNRFIGLALNTQGASNMVVGLNWTNVNNGLRIAGDKFIVVSNVFAQMRGDFCVDASGSSGARSNNLIAFNVFESLYRVDSPPDSSGQYGGPDGVWSGGGNAILYNLFRVSSNTDSAIYTSSQHNDHVQNTGDNVDIAYNEVINIGDSFIDNDCYWDRSPSELNVFNNYAHITQNFDPYPEFFRLYTSIEENTVQSITGVKICNNTIADFDTDYRVIRFDSFANAGTAHPAASGNLVINNVMLNCASNFTFDPHIYIADSTNFTASSFVFSNNVYANNRSHPGYIHFRGTNYAIDAWIQTVELSGKTNMPTFVSYAFQSGANDLRPTLADTVLVNAGLTLSSYFSTDKYGVLRPVGQWDIGAFEATSTTIIYAPVGLNVRVRQ